MKDNDLVGLAGTETCIGVVVVDEGEIYVFHFQTGDDPEPTLEQYDFGDNAHAYVLGGDNGDPSNIMLKDVLEELQDQEVRTLYVDEINVGTEEEPHYHDVEGLWVDREGRAHIFESDVAGDVNDQADGQCICPEQVWN